MTLDKVTCKFCGQTVVYERKYKPRIFCSGECQQAYFHRKRQLAPKPKKEQMTILSRLETPQEQCRKCRYGVDVWKTRCCGYLEIMGHTRTSLHPEGLQGPCQEYQPKKNEKRGG